MTRQDAIQKASELAYEEDANQVVGRDSNGEWVIRHSEDPESNVLEDSVIVDSTGEQQ